MSNTATLRTEATKRSADALIAFARTALVTLALLLIWLSLNPFSGGQPINEGGSVLNQITYTGVLGILLLAMLTVVPPAVATRLVSLPWLLLIGWVVVSGLFVSPAGDVAVRGAMFSVIVVMLAGLIVVCAPTERALLCAVAGASGTILVLSMAGMVLLPNAAVHTAFEAEPQHAGLWRGVFSHKNIAGPVMVLIMFAGIYVARRLSLIAGLLIAVAAFAFVYNTGSKTSLALAPMVLLLVALPNMMGLRAMVPLACVIAIAAAHALTIGSVYLDAFDGIVQTISPDTTYTGRTEIWAFAKDYVLAKPLTGFGYAGFWGTDTVLGAEQPFDRAWDPRGIIHGHNGYLDALLFFGIPGFALMIWATVVSPAFQYVVAIRSPANDAANDFFYMLIVFATLNASLESFFFNRTDPVWLTLVFALFGLRLASWLNVSRT
ncbi:MAG: O-antigen ligase [Pseudomonadota bacterium]